MDYHRENNWATRQIKRYGLTEIWDAPVGYHIPTVTAAMITGTAEEAFDAAEPWLRTVGLVLRKRPKESVAILS